MRYSGGMKLRPLNFRIQRVACRVHPTFLWVFPLFLATTRSVLAALLSFASVLAILVLHELGHAAVAKFCGLPATGIDIYFFHGICTYQSPEYELEHATVAWGGVLAQAILFAGALLMAFVLGWIGPPINGLLNPAVVVLTLGNAVIIVINLLPMRGLDGAIAWKLVPSIFNGDFAGYLRARRRAHHLYR